MKRNSNGATSPDTSYIGKKHKVLSVGVDLSSNGGIASVVKVLYNVKDKKFNYTLLKTCYYKDRFFYQLF